MKDIFEASTATPDTAVAATPAAAAPVAGAKSSAGGKHATAPKQLAPIWARHRVVHLFLKLTIYYCAVTAFVAAALTLFPQLNDYLPIGVRILP